MRIKFGFKTWSTLSAMLLSLVVIAGCNDEGAGTTPTPSPAPSTPPPAATPKGPEMKKPEMPPAPTPPKDEKAAEKK